MISVIIPTHKRADLLFYELEHIYMQKDVDFEVIVVNDIEEEDETDTIREKFPEVIYIKDSKIQGPSEKHKAGLKIAKGEYIYMPDDDDFLIDDLFFKKAYNCMEQDNKLAFVSGQCKISHEYDDISKNYLEQTKLNITGRLSGSDYLQEIHHRFDKPLSTVSTIFRRSALEDKDERNIIEFSDSSIYMLALISGDALILDDTVAIYRVKGGSLSRTASLSFIMNVLRQKEIIYFMSQEFLDRPKDFWYNQLSCTLGFALNTNISDKEKLHIIRWGIKHSHFSLKIISYTIFVLIKEIVRFLINSIGIKRNDK